jgi:hypothetical protein
VTVLVDEARWAWRGQRWAHLCSDHSVPELHAFAEAIGVRRVSFQGDHYDVDATKRAEALAAGAVAVGSRELVRRVRSAGLLGRAVRAQYRWQPLAVVEPGDRPEPGGDGGEVPLAVRLQPALATVVPADRLPGLLQALALVAPSDAGEAGNGPAAGARVLVRPGELAVVVSGGVEPGCEPARADLAALVDGVHRARDRGGSVTELFVRLP